MDGALEIRLPPRVPEPPFRGEPVQRDVERRYLDLVVKRAQRVLVEGLRRGGRVPVAERVRDALVGKAVDVADAAALVPPREKREPRKEVVPME